MCINTSGNLIASLSQRLLEVSEPLIGAKIWRFLPRWQSSDIDQDALVSMSDGVADSYLAERMQGQDFGFFFGSAPFRYVLLPPDTRTKFLKEYLPALFWRSMGEMIGVFFWMLPFFFLFGAVESHPQDFRQAIVFGTLLSALLTFIIWVLVFQGARRKVRPFPYRGFPPSDWRAFRSGIIQLGVFALFTWWGMPVCLVGYCELGLLLSYMLLGSVAISLYVGEDYLKARMRFEILGRLNTNLQLLASIRYVLSRHEPMYQMEKQRIDSDIRTVEELLRSQVKPARTGSLIKGTVTTILAGLIGTGIQGILFGGAFPIDLMNSMLRFQSLVLFSLLSGGIGIISWLLLRIGSHIQVKRMMAHERRVETLMKARTQWLLYHQT
jgi:hypothetical protein